MLGKPEVTRSCREEEFGIKEGASRFWNSGQLGKTSSDNNFVSVIQSRNF